MGSNIAARLLVIAFSLGAAVLPLSAQAPPPNPDKNAYFGETHVHTSWSLDAFAIGNTLTTPGDAYKYFKGEPIKHPLGYEVKIETPLDWAGVTDHSEYAGVVQLANDPKSPVSKIPAGGASRSESEDEGGDGESRALRHQHARPRAAGEGADVSGDRRGRLEEEHRARKPGEPAGEIHRLLLLRVDLDAEQHEPPPEHLLQGVLARPVDALQRAGVLPSGGSLELDGRPAQGGQRASRHLAQREPLRRPHVSHRRRLPTAARSTPHMPPLGRATSR